MSSTDDSDAIEAFAHKPSAFRRIMRSFRWVMHPVTVFVGLQILWVLVIVLWVVWFFERQDQFLEFARMLGNPIQESATGFWSLVIGIVLLVLILIGVVFLFVVAIRQGRMNRQQRSFVSSVTHELRSPLASLRLLLETLRLRKVDAATQEQMLKMMEVDTDRLLRLVDQILVSSRLDRGILTAGAREPVNVSQLIDSVVGQLLYADLKLKSRVKVNFIEVQEVRTIKLALAVIISNLIENAIKYSPPGAPIEITGAAKDNLLTIKVTDHGHGLSRSDKKRIFRMFYRSEDAIKKAIPGTGLGLYIVRETAVVLGGKILVDSKGPGKGSSFSFVMPILESEID